MSPGLKIYVLMASLSRGEFVELSRAQFPKVVYGEFPVGHGVSGSRG